MKSVLVLQHVAHEPLGTLHCLLKEMSFRLRYVNYGRTPDAIVDASSYDGVIVLGGPMGVYESDRYPHLRDEIRIVREAIAAEKPVLGICLGAQLIATALGGEVSRLPTSEIGWYDVDLTEHGRGDPLLAELGERSRIFQWHTDGIRLPEGIQPLASSPACPVQAFRYRHHVYGLQFHLEVDGPMIERWLSMPAQAHQLVGLGGSDAVERVREETQLRISDTMSLGRRVFGRYIELFGSKRRKRVFPSRT